MQNEKPYSAQFRFYEELNDFLLPERRKVAFDYRFDKSPSIKDAIEALGVPHTEVDLILVNSEAVSFDYKLQDRDRVSVYPKFEAIDISEMNKLRPAPLRDPKFILDVHLGKLAKLMRMLGLDCLYETNFADDTIIRLAQQQDRIILTRDKGILKHKVVTHGHYVRATDPQLQLIEICRHFDLQDQLKPFTRCLKCNSELKPIDKQKILHQLDEQTKQYYDDFYFCGTCQKIYWQGSHYDNMQTTIDKLNKS